MSLTMRLRGSLPNGLFLRPNVCHNSLFNSIGLTKQYAQVARKEEEIEYDQRRLQTGYDPATFDPKGHLSPPTDCVWRLVDKIPELKLMEVAELGSIMMKKVALKIPLIVNAKKPGSGLVSMGAMKGMAATEEAMPGRTACELKLESFDAPPKIKPIKEDRLSTDLGLKEAKDLVESVPSVFKMDDSREGEKTIERKKALGANVVMEKNEFELKLESFEAPAKFKLIKEIRSCTYLGLIEAKDLVENIPSVFKKGVSREEGEKIIEKMKALGAKVVMEKNEFELKLESFDAPAMINLVREVRSLTGLGLKEAIDLVKSVPSVFKKGVSREEGEKIIEKMKALGAKVVME